MQSSGLYKELIYACSMLHSRRNQVRVLPNSTSALTSGAGSTVVFTLPDRSIIDPSTTFLESEFSITSCVAPANASYALVPPSYQLFSNTMLTLNGVAITGSLNQYAHLTENIHYKLQSNYQQLASRQNENLQNMKVLINAGTAAGLGDIPIAAAATVGSNTEWITWSNIPCLRSCKYIDTSIFGRAQVTLRSSSANIVKAWDPTAAAQVVVNQWALNNLALWVTVVQPPALYVSVIEKLVASNVEMMIPFYDCVSAVYSAQNSIRLNFSTDCNDGFVFAPLGAAGALAATAIASGSAEASMFKNNFSALTTNNDVCDIYYRYGNTAYPQSGVINRMNTLAELTNVSQWGDDYDQQSLLFVQNFIRGSTSASAGQYFLRDSFSQQNTVSYINVSGDRTAGWYDASLAGVSTRGLDVILVANYGGLANANDLLLFACNTSRAVFSPATGSVYCVR